MKFLKNEISHQHSGNFICRLSQRQHMYPTIQILYTHTTFHTGLHKRWQTVSTTITVY